MMAHSNKQNESSKGDDNGQMAFPFGGSRKGADESSQRGEAPPPEGLGEADYYLNEQGLLVFTEKYHLERGYCCGSGCKHCPFDYEAVPEPKRSTLRKLRTEKGENETNESSG